MKNIAIIFSTSPHQLANSREALDAALALSAYHHVSLFFLGDGLLNLLPAQQPEVILSRNFIKTFGVVELYEIEHCYCYQEDLLTYQLDPNSLALVLQPLSKQQLHDSLQQQQAILRF